MLENYYDVSEATFPERIDEAWADYKDENLSKESRAHALKFLIYAFDIKQFSHEKDSLNQILTALMEKREHKRTENPHYLPILHSGQYDFYETARSIARTDSPKHSTDENIQNAFDKGELLDVVRAERRLDAMMDTTFLDDYERGEYNLEIYNGLFYKKRKLFDSSLFIAHNKPGYVAFTLNTNGELSVFSHRIGAEDLSDRGRRLVHSSMNAGAPVLAAGEMEIRAGKLISINNYSGHYTPTLFSVARFLEYLSARDMDLSKTQVMLLNPPHPESRLQSTPVIIEGSSQQWRSIAANDIIKSARSIIESNLAAIQAYLNSSKTKFKQKFFKSEVTQQKIELLQTLTEELTYIQLMTKATFNFLMLRESLKSLETTLVRYEAQYNELRPHGIGRVRGLFDEMRKQIYEAQNSLGSKTEEEEQRRIASYKQSR